MATAPLVAQWVVESDAGHLYGVASDRPEAVALMTRLQRRPGMPGLTIYRVPPTLHSAGG